MINLAGEFKLIGKIWLKCRVVKSPPTLEKAIEEIKGAIERIEENHEKQALLARKEEKKEDENTPHHTYPRCRPGFHNTLTQHPESKCRNLKLGKPTALLVCSPTKQDQNSIVLDSGASNRMFNNQTYFITFFPKEEEVLLADGYKIKTLGSGTTRIELPHMYLNIRNSHLIPQLSVNLLSPNSFINANYTVKKASNLKCFKVLNTKVNLILNGTYEIGNFVIFQQKPNAYNVTLPSTKIITLHQAYGHPSIDYFKKMSQDTNITPFSCITSNISKMTKTPFSASFPIPSRKIEVLHLDLCGSISPESISGKKYFLRIVYGFSHYVWIYFFKTKSDTKDIIKNHINKVERQAKLLVGSIVSDNGSEFKHNDLSCSLLRKASLT
ncbi:hypothetical protein O181_004245 [Austropuccinia psidii MF-1]|uniref:Integrase catalytic domain-containing protein n=1 Tax=Austropuccinia psidii MF-1 TaxID=1389203 RepID=A0A9Q3GEP0_9BASI|nr:hypothetical protein [Austropuccinia psidii MF-1]